MLFALSVCVNGFILQNNRENDYVEISLTLSILMKNIKIKGIFFQSSQFHNN